MKYTKYMFPFYTPPTSSNTWNAKKNTYLNQWKETHVTLAKLTKGPGFGTSTCHEPLVGGWTNPFRKICSSNWIISPSRVEHKTYWKPPPRKYFKTSWVVFYTISWFRFRYTSRILARIVWHFSMAVCKRPGKISTCLENPAILLPKMNSLGETRCKLQMFQN